MSSPTGTLRNGMLLPPASTSRRWWARILDAVFVVTFTGFLIGFAFALYGVNVISIDAATGVALISYPLLVLLFGALYGCTVSPGQALCGVVSLQTAHGRRVGFWRGMGRYLAIGFFPIALLLLVWVLLDAPAIDSAPIRVYRRSP
ncbi:RDD family protein [Brevibacterium renqingii]|uniref:RDD family protein n=1 Tax=Brevibacterium renqingii TaxID=2776916 RepID=UPI001ADF1270|nr:RDD family protein [Brevibacterium renqingii]